MRTTVPASIEIGDDAVAIVGGGLSGMLAAWRIAEVNPDVEVHLFERSQETLWKHHWSFNISDIPETLRMAVTPMIRKRWDRYDVRFPRRSRTLEIGYASTDDLAVLAQLDDLRRQGRVVLYYGQDIDPADIRAGAVLDARGYIDRDDTLASYQKFVGRRVRLSGSHGLEHPVIMDATVDQFDGYRFMYLLPFTDREVLVEDTYFSDSPDLGENIVTSRIEDYIASKGWEVEAVTHTEKGVLPMTTASTRDDDTAEIGLRGGFGIAATGFTFPVALELAEHVAQAVKKHGVSKAEIAVAEFRRTHIRRERYARLLNRMFFGAAAPERRYVILQRFYGFRSGLIERFYRNALTPLDKVRILIGKPPVPVTKALYNFSEKRFMRRARAEADE